MKNKIATILLSLLAFFSCSKRRDDHITQKKVQGMVYNRCTDKGLADATVYLKVVKNESQVKEYSTTSQANGEFIFESVDIHASADYSYVIYIPSKSAIGSQEAGITGTSLYFEGHESDMYFMPRVTPKFLNFCMDFAPNTVFDAKDSIQVHVVQKIFHKNEPELPFEWTIGDYGISAPDCASQYPMGLWNITIHKWKNNVHTVEEDSIFLGWGDTKTYLVNW